MYKIKQIPEDFVVEEIPLYEFKDSGEYTYFLLEKKNYNTEKAVQKLSKIFKISRKKFSYAGNKDKIAVTKQYVSVLGKLKDIDLGDIKIKKVGYGDEPISLGDLKGNKFIITVRNICKKPKKISFIINYFDEQRFGKNNLEIGLAILRKKFKKAAELIDLAVVKEHLAKNQNDFVGAIKKVPFKILNLYIHAVQSWLWNEVTADYIKQKTKNYSEIKYRHGKFVFSEKRIENIETPLIAFDTEFDNKDIESIYVKILEKNKLTLHNFIIRSIPEITPLGNNRNLIADVKNIKISKLEDDELNKGKKKVLVEFELGKGCYATIVIKKMFL
jgi:tRNA pseudouridine13 synthase